MEEKRRQINWSKEPYCNQLEEALKDYSSRRANNEKISLDDFSKEKKISKSVLQRNLHKREQQTIQDIKDKKDRDLADMVIKGGRWNYEPIEKNVSALSASPEPRAVRKQPTRSTKQSWSKRGEFACSCKNDGAKKCVIGECGNDVSEMECNNYICSFGDIDCGNRRYLRHYLTSCVRRNCGQSLEGQSGLFAFEDIPQFVFIGQYVGEIKSMKDVSGFYCAEGRSGGKSFVVDSQGKGNLTRFINHSCDPNCLMINRNVMGESQIWIQTLKEIKQDEELTFDYKWKRGDFPGQCFCGTKKCRY